MGRSSSLSTRTRKQIDSLPDHAQEIYKKAHANALEEYQRALPMTSKKRSESSSKDVAVKDKGLNK